MSPGSTTPSDAPAPGGALARRRGEPRVLERVGRYTVLTEIAGGGMGSVLLGLMRGSAEFSRLVAIKCLHTRWLDDPKYVARFKREVKLAARIQHPNVVQALDVVEHAGELFLVMEYVDGVTLGALLADLNRQGRALPLGIAAGIVAAVLRGLQAAHEATDELGQPLNIVHRDVSPQNIMISRSGFVQVLDFGAAKAVDHSQHTAAGAFVGKLSYMAPEQVLGEASSPGTDVFAAGVVLWEALTGRRLFHDSSLARGELLHALVLKPIARPSELRAEVPAALDEVLAQALERDPQRRFQSASAFAAALEGAVPALTGSPLADLVKDVCAARLAEREGLLRGGLAEAASEASVPTAREPLARLAPQLSQQLSAGLVAAQRVRPVRRARQVWLGAALLGAGVIGGVMLSWRGARLEAGEAIAPALSAVSLTEAPSARVELVTEESAAPDTPAPEARAEALAPEARAEALAPVMTKQRSSGHRQPGASRAQRASKRPSCDPPTYVDSEGIRHFKRQCL